MGYDFFQTGSHITVNIYAKTTDPDKSSVELSSVRLTANITFSGEKTFYLDVVLQGLVDVAQSSVTVAPTKVEIKLKKANIKSWSKLGTVKETEDSKIDEQEDTTEKITRKVDVVDLSDL